MMRERIWRLFCIDGIPASRIDGIMGYASGTSRRIIADYWRWASTEKPENDKVN